MPMVCVNQWCKMYTKLRFSSAAVLLLGISVNTQVLALGETLMKPMGRGTLQRALMPVIHQAEEYKAGVIGRNARNMKARAKKLFDKFPRFGLTPADHDGLQQHHEARSMLPPNLEPQSSFGSKQHFHYGHMPPGGYIPHPYQEHNFNSKGKYNYQPSSHREFEKEYGHIPAKGQSSFSHSEVNYGPESYSAHSKFYGDDTRHDSESTYKHVNGPVISTHQESIAPNTETQQANKADDSNPNFVNIMDGNAFRIIDPSFINQDKNKLDKNKGTLNNKGHKSLSSNHEITSPGHLSDAINPNNAQLIDRENTAYNQELNYARNPEDTLATHEDVHLYDHDKKDLNIPAFDHDSINSIDREPINDEMQISSINHDTYSTKQLHDIHAGNPHDMHSGFMHWSQMHPNLKHHEINPKDFDSVHPMEEQHNIHAGDVQSHLGLVERQGDRNNVYSVNDNSLREKKSESSYNSNKAFDDDQVKHEIANLKHHKIDRQDDDMHNELAETINTAGRVNENEGHIHKEENHKLCVQEEISQHNGFPSHNRDVDGMQERHHLNEESEASQPIHVHAEPNSKMHGDKEEFSPKHNLDEKSFAHEPQVENIHLDASRKNHEINANNPEEEEDSEMQAEPDHEDSAEIEGPSVESENKGEANILNSNSNNQAHAQHNTVPDAAHMSNVDQGPSTPSLFNRLWSVGSNLLQNVSPQMVQPRNTNQGDPGQSGSDYPDQYQDQSNSNNVNPGAPMTLAGKIRAHLSQGRDLMNTFNDYSDSLRETLKHVKENVKQTYRTLTGQKDEDKNEKKGSENDTEKDTEPGSEDGVQNQRSDSQKAGHDEDLGEEKMDGGDDETASENNDEPKNESQDQEEAVNQASNNQQETNSDDSENSQSSDVQQDKVVSQDVLSTESSATDTDGIGNASNNNGAAENINSNNNSPENDEANYDEGSEDNAAKAAA